MKSNNKHNNKLKREDNRSQKNSNASKRFIIIRFLGIFAILISLYYLSVSSGWFDSLIMAYADSAAKATSWILVLLGEDASSKADILSSSRYSLVVGIGCEGSEPIALFLSALIAFPIAWKLKIRGILVGSAALYFLNLFRIVGLYYSGIYYPDMFNMLHVEIFPIVFIVIALILWVIWLQWASGQIKAQRV